MTQEEYRAKFDIPLEKRLTSNEVRKKISTSQKSRLHNKMLNLFQNTRFLKDYYSGLPYDGLCEKYDICLATIYNYKKELLLGHRKSGHEKRKDEKRKFIKSSGIRKDYLSGMRQIDISRKYMIPPTTLNGWMSKGYFE